LCGILGIGVSIKKSPKLAITLFKFIPYNQGQTLMSFVAYWVVLDMACPQHVPKNRAIENLKSHTQQHFSINYTHGS
jgi:hypothetical protein